ncbi:MAG: hypothetical protein HY286_12245 [Planctomycetes bacterium]|nr:hypothetical protein [Planctomycetota bacterium]
MFAGLLFAILAVEGTLQILAYIKSFETARRLQSTNPQGLPTVVFVGDSNIYGLYFEKEQTLPAAVARLSMQNGSPGVHCINFGVPGSPSWVVLDQLRRTISLKPAAIVARCGINNLSVMSADEGFGIFENLRIVKAARQLLFNWKYRNARSFAVRDDAEGADSGNRGLVMETGDRKICWVPPRDGESTPVEMIKVKGAHPYEDLKPRLRSDLKKMADLASDNNIKLIFAGYLASADTGFRDVRDVTRTFDGYRDAIYIDCASVIPQVLGLGDRAHADVRITERVHALRSLILTNDRHPTPFGYEVEAHMITNALVDAGVSGVASVENAVDFLKKEKINIPFLGRSPGRELAYNYKGNPGDRITLVFGEPGSSFHDSIDLPFNIHPILNKIGAATSARMSATAGADGGAKIEVPIPTIPSLKSARKVACIVERGGRGGAAQILLSRVLDFEPGK